MDEQDRAWQVNIESLDDRIHKLDERLSTLERVTPAIELRNLLESSAKHLEIVLRKRPVEWSDGKNGVLRCGWCELEMTRDSRGYEAIWHSNDCPYVAAKKFLDDLESEL